MSPLLQVAFRLYNYTFTVRDVLSGQMMLAVFSGKLSLLVRSPVIGLTQTQKPLLHCSSQKCPVSGSQQTCGELICNVRQSVLVMESAEII